MRVTRMGAGVLLEPMPDAKKESMEELFARMDAMEGIRFSRGPQSRILLRFVSTSSELPARHQCLHCVDQWNLQQSSRSFHTGRPTQRHPYIFIDCCS